MMRLLIANRGEIARRVLRTAHRLGHHTIAVYADPDRHAPFVHDASEAVRIGPAALADSYLSIDALLAAAAKTGADAIHPGYGFLSENADFARAVVEAGLTWVGPKAEAIDRMGSKIDARKLARAAGVPIIPGYDDSQDPGDLRPAADEIGYPILVKAAAGGGGKGIRIAHSPDDFDTALRDARAESARSFGDDAVIVERYIQQPRHVEVQIVGDRAGKVIHLGTRECSVQRRYQKMLEEAPAPNLATATREQLQASAVDLAASIGYDSTGTVEFIVDDSSGEYFFLEMNTRLQVEHPVTEAVTGLDLVELQLLVAEGRALPLDQDDVTFTGHAFEARINAEDPSADFAAQIGTIGHVEVPPGVRWDSGIEAGSTITPYYDSMVAKLIVHGPNRTAARTRLATALDRLLIGGLTTNTGFQRWLIEQPPVVDGRVTTRFLDEVTVPDTTDPIPVAERAARAWADAERAAAAPTAWAALGPFRMTPHHGDRLVSLQDLAGEAHDVSLPNGTETERAGNEPVCVVDLDRRLVVINDCGQSHTFSVLTRSQRWAPDESTGHGHAGAVVAPFPAIVAELPVNPGDDVAAGDPVIVIEAMKMLHTLSAGGPGTVEDVRVNLGDQVESQQILVTFVSDDEANE